MERSKVLRDKIRDEFKEEDGRKPLNKRGIRHISELTDHEDTDQAERLQHIADRFRRFFTSITYNEAIPIKDIKVFRAP